MIKHFFSANHCTKLQTAGQITFATLILSCLLLGSPVRADSTTRTSSEIAQKSAQCAMSVAEITDLIGNIQAGAPAEWLAAKDIVMHQPGEEIFLGLVHPDAALFEQSFSLDGAVREHENFICLLRDSGARIFKLTDILLAGTVDGNGHVIQGKPLTDLQQFAEKALTYDTAGLPANMQAGQQAYRQKVIHSLHPKELIKIIFQRPTVKLSSTESLNTGFVASYTLDPVMNMYFMRDQVITTPKGIVLGKFNSRQRDAETEIADFAYRKLGTTPIYAVQGDGRLEGGDFLVAGDISFLGQGLRTNEQAVKQLLEAGVFGTKRVVIVKDPWQNQIQMHLDTYFNLISDKLAAMVQDRLDIKDESGKVIGRANPKKKPTADIYELQGDSYKLIASNLSFQDFLESIGYKIVPVSEDDQLKYGLNFLTTSSNKILAIDGVSPAYKDRLKAEGVDATWMDFRNLTSGYGAAHCTTQVIRRGR